MNLISIQKTSKILNCCFNNFFKLNPVFCLSLLTRFFVITTRFYFDRNYCAYYYYFLFSLTHFFSTPPTHYMVSISRFFIVFSTFHASNKKTLKCITRAAQTYRFIIIIFSQKKTKKASLGFCKNKAAQKTSQSSPTVWKNMRYLCCFLLRAAKKARQGARLTSAKKMPSFLYNNNTKFYCYN